MPAIAVLITLFVTLLLTMASTVRGEEPMTRQELEQWFADDSEQRALAVNEGQLVFLPEAPGGRVPHSHNTFTIGATSIDDGWVTLAQCYDGLDPVAAAQVVYRYRQMRHLHVTGAADIGRTWVEGNSVQMQDVGHQARLCIAAEVRVFYQNPDHSFSLVNGPYHRKFLDGYYPMHVTLLVRYPHDRLSYVNMKPQLQPGLALRQDDSGLQVEAWFEGELNTEIRFRER
jgi:hypothetical protein